jgi:hypothetical protein
LGRLLQIGEAEERRDSPVGGCHLDRTDPHLDLLLGLRDVPAVGVLR